MREELEVIINSCFNEGEACLSFMQWNEVLNEVDDDYTVYYLIDTVHYYMAYYCNSAINLSLVLYENKKAIAVFPLFAYKNSDGWILSSNGVFIFEPLFITNITVNKRKRLEKKIMDMIIKLSKQLDIKTNKFSTQFNKISSWYLLWLEVANNEFVNHHLVVNLDSSIEFIKSNFRKRYKPLITKAIREWNISICTDNIYNVFEDFRVLHREVSGRVTRSLDTWEIQLRQIINNEAFLVTVRDANGNLVGGGLFTFTRKIGVYSVGVYRRELFHMPIGHGVQFKAIEHLKALGCKWYEIGQRQYLIDMYPPTEKELSISHFKEGFATNYFVRPFLMVKIV